MLNEVLLGFDIDIISRKLKDGAEDSNFLIRLNEITQGFSLLFSSPFGYKVPLESPGTPLIIWISAYSGWIGVIILTNFFVNFFHKVIIFVRFTNTGLSQKYGVSLMFSCILIALFVSGYGWNRPVGYIVSFLFFRVLLIYIGYTCPPIIKKHQGE